MNQTDWVGAAQTRDAFRLSEQQARAAVAAFARDGFVLLREHFDAQVLRTWADAFRPLLERHLETEGAQQNRGSARYYVTLPFTAPFADPAVFADPDVLRICRLLVGDDMWMCQLATDTPLHGSSYQDVHRDAPPLFPETGSETPPYQLAVNFPLVDVRAANGPLEVMRGTHQQAKEIGLARLERGESVLEPIEMQLGDVMIRDVRGLHRGTPNTTDVPRPMVVIGYSRRWLFRPEVGIRIAQTVWDRLTEDQRYLLRFNTVVPDAVADVQSETYRTFAF